MLEPHGITWNPIVIDVDIRRIKDDAARERAIALLLITLDECSNGAIPLGYGVNRGYGSLAVDKISAEATDDLTCEATDDLTCVAKALKNAPKILKKLDSGLRERLKQNWPPAQNPEPEGSPA